MYSINKGFLAELLKSQTTKAGGIRAICKLLGISTSSYYNYINELTSPDMSFLENIATLTKTPLPSFFNGMSEASVIPSDPLLSELVTIYNNLDDYQKTKLMEYARDRQKLSEYNKTHGNDNIVFKKTGHNK